MTATERIVKYLSMITKMNMDQRPKILYKGTGKFYIISTFDDVTEVLSLVRRAPSKMRPYQEDWYYSVFVQEYKNQNGKPKDGYNDVGMRITETVVGVTTDELATKTAQVMKCPKPSTDQIRKKYLDPLVNLGLVNKHDSRLDLKSNIYSLVDESAASHKEIEKFSVRNPDVFPSRVFLEQSLRRIVTYSEDGPDKEEKNETRTILDCDGREMSVAELIDRYFGDANRVFTLEDQQ